MENVQFILCDIKDDLCREWNTEILNKLTTEQQKQFVVFNDRLSEYPGKFDCIVSPANSYARLDGSFDYYISDMFCHDFPGAVTDHCQEYLHAIYNGYQTPGTCLLIPMQQFGDNKFKCKWIAHCPTMRMPSNCKWNKDVVYNCMWNLLCEVDRHNKYRKGDGSKNNLITSVFLTGLGTGVGGFPANTCASQMILAYKHYRENLVKVSPTTSWPQATAFGMDIDETIRTSSFLSTDGKNAKGETEVIPGTTVDGFLDYDVDYDTVYSDESDEYEGEVSSKEFIKYVSIPGEKSTDASTVTDSVAEETCDKKD